MLKQIITWAILIFLAFYMITQPTGAADAIHSLLNLLRDAGQSLATFVG